MKTDSAEAQRRERRPIEPLIADRKCHDKAQRETFGVWRVAADDDEQTPIAP
jgi:hypothetical protein